MILMECLFVIAISGILFLCISRAYPQLVNMLAYSYHQYHLDLLLRERLVVLEAELRRAGYCKGQCNNELNTHYLKKTALKIGSYLHHSYGSCVIFAYDMNNNGYWDPPYTKESDYFGYRLKNGQLEQLRGVKDCHSVGWQQFFENNEINVTEFILTPHSQIHPINGKSLFYLSISLKFELKKNPQVKSYYQNLIFLRNISH